MPKMTLEEIRQHWYEAGLQFPDIGTVTPTSRDPFLGEMEARNVLDHLSGCGNVLEVGCGDASHTVKYAKEVGQLTAMDVAGSLLEIAAKRLASLEIDNVEIVEGSVVNLPAAIGEKQFDCVVSQRCLINLPDWEHQQKAIVQIADALVPGGTLLLTEGFRDGLDEINIARTAVGLDPINVVAYNCNFDRRQFESYVTERFDVVETRDYGLYLFLSRVFHPLVSRPEPPTHDAKLNRVAAELSAVSKIAGTERYSYNLFYALRKK